METMITYGLGWAVQMKIRLSTWFTKLPLTNNIMHCLKFQTDFHFYSNLTFDFIRILNKHASQDKNEIITCPVLQLICIGKLSSSINQQKKKKIPNTGTMHNSIPDKFWSKDSNYISIQHSHLIEGTCRCRQISVLV